MVKGISFQFKKNGDQKDFLKISNIITVDRDSAARFFIVLFNFHPLRFFFYESSKTFLRNAISKRSMKICTIDDDKISHMKET